MNLPAALTTISWMIRDTFRLALASGVFWATLAISLVCIVLCLSVGFSGPDLDLGDPKDKHGVIPKFVKIDPKQAATSGVVQPDSEFTFFFGLIRMPMTRDRAAQVRNLELILAAGVAGAGGLLLSLIWTGGFLPTFLEPGSVAVLLAKPIPRWALLAGKYLGVLTFVLTMSTLFVVGTWTALGLRTGVWDGRYLLAVPMLLLHFAFFFSFSTMLAVLSRSTVTCVFGSILFWAACMAMNYGRHMMVIDAAQQSPSAVSQVKLPEPPGPKKTGKTDAVVTPEVVPDDHSISGMHFPVEVGYWILPKPADLLILLQDAVGVESDLQTSISGKQLQKLNAFHPELSILTSLLFTVVILAISAYEFVTTDY